MRNIIAALVILLLLSAPVQAGDAAGWSGRITLGITDSSGNSDTSSANGDLQLELATESWKHALRARGRRVESDDVVTVERYRAGMQSDYNFTEYNYFFVTLDYEQDRPAGLRWRTSETVGYGRRLLKREGLSLDAEIGAGLRQTRAQDEERTRESDTIGRLASQLDWEMAEGRRFLQEVLVEDGKNNTYLESNSELRTNVVGNLYSQVSYTVKRNSDVPADTKKTDRYFALSLGYSF